MGSPEFADMGYKSPSSDSSSISASTVESNGVLTPITLFSSPPKMCSLGDFNLDQMATGTPNNSNGSDDSFQGPFVGYHPAIPPDCTQAMVNASPELKRFQQDLLILTGFPDNSSLHWRPLWFAQEHFASRFWTLHNPPNVVTEALPCSLGLDQSIPPVYTRRMRRPYDPPPRYIKTWDDWSRICAMYGIPEDFLSEQMVEFMRLGLSRSYDGTLLEPPDWPLYPEPQPLGHDIYLLDPTCHSRLPRLFESIDEGQVIAVLSTGIMKVTPADIWYLNDRNQCSHYNGFGQLVDDRWYDADMNEKSRKYQGKGRRWSHIPWTEDQRKSCKLIFKLRIGKV